jgi:hypothetical protein
MGVNRNRRFGFTVTSLEASQADWAIALHKT